MKTALRIAIFSFVFVMFVPRTASASALAPTVQAESLANTAAPVSTSPKVTAYTLTSDLRRKAHLLGQIAFWGQIVGFFYTVFVLLLILRWRLASKFRDWAENCSPSRFVQVLIFAPSILLAIAVLGIPLDIATEWVSKRFGLSIQSWTSWLWDWTKGELVSILIGIVLISILYAVIRRRPRRWWFYFWLAALPLGVFLIFLQPLVVDPLFHKFEPLASKDPVLTASLEQMVQRAGQDIPPERMFWMGAGEKTTSLNAYVTGIGASKRIVVWDTTIAKMNTPQIVFVTGHEMGHYVLGHIWKGMIFGAVCLFVMLWIGSKIIGAMLAGSANKWGIRDLGDWASFPALLLVLTVLAFIANPIFSAFSRHDEHQADQYGLEVTHGLTPDSAQVGAQAFQVLGEVDLSDPDPNPLGVFLFYSHPAIPDRVRFALTYDPWASGGTGEFVK
jgi:Zn-dependent protease with chaperone function